MDTAEKVVWAIVFACIFGFATLGLWTGIQSGIANSECKLLGYQEGRYDLFAPRMCLTIHYLDGPPRR